MAKTKENTPVNISIGAISVNIEFNSQYTEAQKLIIKNKILLAMSEAISSI
jgi:hypothetical protein